jgi:CDP-glucose 4,6-dehydratase
MIEFAPEVIFHLAAQPLVRRSYAYPLVTYATNIMGTAHVMEAVRRTPSVRAVVCITSDKCYQNQEWVWPYRETDPLGGYDPYSASKACAELVVAASRSSYFPEHRQNEHHVQVATARAGNVIGGGDWSEDRLIPDLIRGFQARRPMLIRHPHAIRPWQHVLEPLHGYMLLAEKLLSGDTDSACAFNFGPGEEESWPVERIANQLAALWGDGATWTVDSVQEMHEAHFLRVDSSKACEKLGWRPRLGIERALEWTLHWYRSWEQGAEMNQVTLAQIRDFERLGC